MAQPDRLQTLEQLAAFNETQASRQLAERLRALDTEDQRLRQLQGYVGEYAARRADGAATSVAALTAGRRFVDRLQTAVRQQAEVVQRARQTVDQATAQWRAARARRLALARLREREAARLAERRDRRDQARLDELATTRAARAGSDRSEL